MQAISQRWQLLKLSGDGVTAIEYALISAGLTLVLVTAVSTLGTDLSLAMANVVKAFTSFKQP
jgi:Flp pilus assembly pilin Flp